MSSTSVFFSTALNWASYLHHPPPSSWVARTAATFRILALLLILPCIFLTALDVASYLVVRTLGADAAHRLDSVNAAAEYASDPRLEKVSGGAMTASDTIPPPTAPALAPTPTSASPTPASPPPTPQHKHTQPLSLSFSLPPSPQFDMASALDMTQLRRTPHSETCFSTSSDANFALAGEGIFSPPGSRSASPPMTRSSRAAGCGGGGGGGGGNVTEGEDGAVMRRRL